MTLKPLQTKFLSFIDPDYPMSIHIIGSGYKGKYIVLSEDPIHGPEIIEVMTSEDIKRHYRIDIDED